MVVQVILGASIHRPIHLLVVDTEKDVGDDSAAEERCNHPIIMLPVSEIEPTVVWLLVGALPRIYRWWAVVVIACPAFAPTCVVRISVQDDEVESVSGEFVEEGIDRFELSDLALRIRIP